ncbi:MAG TPA: hypothetical protein VD837_14080 [Terriglobales bacterium]|nr:hypothetical protein [Terriglobales bacterium]
MNLSSGRRFALVVPIQVVAALLLLWYAYPIYWDGAGPMPSFFYSGDLPSTAEYHTNEWQYDARFLFPYLVASLLLVAVAFVLAPKIAKRIDRRRTTLFIISFSLLFAVAAILDVLVRTARLNCGVFLSFAPDSILAFLMVVVPVALLSALFADR